MKNIFTYGLAAGAVGILLAGAVGCASGGGGGGGGGGQPPADTDMGPGDEPVEFTLCQSPGGEDNGIDFDGFGSTRLTFSSIGLGRHVLLLDGQTLTFQFDQPIPFCAVNPDNIKLVDRATDQDIPLLPEQLTRENILDDQGEVIASIILVELPDSLTAGSDYELTFDSQTLGLDGEFQQNPGTANRSNGTLPSGDGNPGGDFVQLFRAIGFGNFLTSTQQAAGMDLDDNDNLYILSQNGLFGPFDSPKEVAGGDQLAANLPSLASRPIVVNNAGNIVVKDNISDGVVFEVDPNTGQAQQIATSDGSSLPEDFVVAPAGYGSVERSAVEPGDVIVSDTGSLFVLDVRAGAGKKGNLNFVDRAGLITDTYVSLFVPPAVDGAPQVVYGTYKPEEGPGFEMHRILPNGGLDRSGFTNPSILREVEATAAIKLDTIQGRQEYLILGTVDQSLVDLRQNLPPDFDSRALMIYNETENRLQVLGDLPIDAFAFTFGPFSDVVMTSDLDTAYVSLPNLNTVVQFTGFSNGADSAGDPPCDSALDDGLAVADGSARVFRSTLGNGRHLLMGVPAVLQFDMDQPVPLCAVNSDNIRLGDVGTGQSISLDGQRMTRRLITDEAANVSLGCRITIDLPSSLTAGSLYELTFDSQALGLDGEFASNGDNGHLPSGDGTPGGDFVQVFQLIQGDYFLTETGGATGIDLDGNDELYASTAVNIMGPFAAPATPGPADTIAVGSGQEISGTDALQAGKPMVANDEGGAAAATYASLRNNRLYDADPVTGITEIFQVGFGQPGLGSFEIDMVQAPAGFAGDYIVHNEQRGVLFNIASGDATTLFESDNQIDDFRSIYVTPASLGGPSVLATQSNTFDSTLTVVEIASDGQQTPRFQTLSGATGQASAQLQDYLGDDEYLILGQWDRSEATLATEQISDTGSGTELILYNPAQNRVQVMGMFSAGSDMTFTQDVETIFTAHPDLRAALRFEGL
ncbi:MAG: hypothetical protein ACE5GE_02515 [Phycisphaerae bacterium]